MGVKMIIPKTKAPESLKLLNHIMSYMFEQEQGEFRGYSRTNVDAFLRQLRQIVKKQ